MVDGARPGHGVALQRHDRLQEVLLGPGQGAPPQRDLAEPQRVHAPQQARALLGRPLVHAPGNLVGDVEVVVSNPSGSPGGARLPSGGHGLVGLRQRVAVFDGSLEAGSQGERFVVRAVMRVPDAVPAVAAQGAAR